VPYIMKHQQSIIGHILAHPPACCSVSSLQAPIQVLPRSEFASRILGSVDRREIDGIIPQLLAYESRLSRFAKPRWRCMSLQGRPLNEKPLFSFLPLRPSLVCSQQSSATCRIMSLIRSLRKRRGLRTTIGPSTCARSTTMSLARMVLEKSKAGTDSSH
jgi:hypothetical protein